MKKILGIIFLWAITTCLFGWSGYVAATSITSHTQPTTQPFFIKTIDAPTTSTPGVSSPSIFMVGKSCDDTACVSAALDWTYGMQVEVTNSSTQAINFTDDAGNHLVRLLSTGEVDIMGGAGGDGNGNMQIRAEDVDGSVGTILELVAVTSSADYLKIESGISGAGPSLTASGSGADVPLFLGTTGDGQINLVGGSNTTTVTLGVGGSKPGCIVIVDTDLAGGTYCTTLNGTMTCSSSTCY